MSWRFKLITRPYGGVTEGPIWDGDNILFTNIPSHRILRYDPDSNKISEHRADTNHTNGLAHDSLGNLYGCCSGGRSIVKFGTDGKTTTVADQVDGIKLNTPNDLTVDRQGRIWFTNPWNAGNIDPSEKQIMADKGKRDKGKREQQKKAKLTPKEKRQQKKDKKKTN